MKSSFVVILALLGAADAKAKSNKKSQGPIGLVSADSFSSWGDGWDANAHKA